MTDRAGQAAITLRHALRARDPDAWRLVRELDAAHSVEVLLGAAIRGGLGGLTSTHAYLVGDWETCCATLPEPSPLDKEALGFVVRRQVQEGWSPDGGGVVEAAVRSMPQAVRALTQASGGAVLARVPERALSLAVRTYYQGPIRALGVRPLLILAGCPE